LYSEFTKSVRGSLNFNFRNTFENHNNITTFPTYQITTKSLNQQIKSRAYDLIDLLLWKGRFDLIDLLTKQLNQIKSAWIFDCCQL
jgi:nicotinamide riboside kinase